MQRSDLHNTVHASKACSKHTNKHTLTLLVLHSNDHKCEEDDWQPLLWSLNLPFSFHWLCFPYMVLFYSVILYITLTEINMDGTSQCTAGSDMGFCFCILIIFIFWQHICGLLFFSNVCYRWWVVLSMVLKVEFNAKLAFKGLKPCSGMWHEVSFLPQWFVQIHQQIGTRQSTNYDSVFSVHKTILAASWMLWWRSDCHIVPGEKTLIHSKCAHGEGLWKIMKTFLWEGCFCAALSVCVCVNHLVEHNDKPMHMCLDVREHCFFIIANPKCLMCLCPVSFWILVWMQAQQMEGASFHYEPWSLTLLTCWLLSQGYSIGC